MYVWLVLNRTVHGLSGVRHLWYYRKNQEKHQRCMLCLLRERKLSVCACYKYPFTSSSPQFYYTFVLPLLLVLYVHVYARIPKTYKQQTLIAAVLPFETN